MRRLTAGHDPFPLLVLSLIYFFDELDTAAFGTLAPDIQRSFHLSDNDFVGLIVINVLVTILFAIPMGHLADRTSRRRLVVGCSALAGVCTFATGLVGTVTLLALVRLGNGVGVLANVPVHNSLLADHYPADVRPVAYATHVNAMYAGAVVGPALAGVTSAIVGWRIAFLVLIAPIAAVTVLALRLTEPRRGAADGGTTAEPAPLSFRLASLTLWRIPTIRRKLIGTMIFGAGALPWVAYAPLFLERSFGLVAWERGMVMAANAAVTFVGVVVAAKGTISWYERSPALPLQRVGAALAGVGVCLLVTAAAPNLTVAVIAGLALSFLSGLVFAPLYSISALVSPPAVRSLSFSLSAIAIVVGVLGFYASGLGSISDDHGIRWGIAALVPFWICSGVIVASAGQFVRSDAAALVRGGPAGQQVQTVEP
jgi:MFS family permease